MLCFLLTEFAVLCSQGESRVKIQVLNSYAAPGVSTNSACNMGSFSPLLLVHVIDLCLSGFEVSFTLANCSSSARVEWATPHKS
jgi:hypothetical protein